MKIDVDAKFVFGIVIIIAGLLVIVATRNAGPPADPLPTILPHPDTGKFDDLRDQTLKADRANLRDMDRRIDEMQATKARTEANIKEAETRNESK